MGKLVLSLLIGLVGAGLVHIAVIFAMPSVAERNAWSRLADLGEPYALVRVQPLESEPGTVSASTDAPVGDFAFVDPAFITAGCRFSLERGPVRIYARERNITFWSASIYNRQGDNLYSINDRAAIDGIVDLLVGTRDQIVDAEAENETGGSRIPVEVETVEGYMTIRALVDEESKRPFVDSFIQSVQCEAAEELAGR
ncbi:DUF1254 domain-containing protein [Jiella marina]|uniref:DUF1254 domain-containing protein n=1 Tax=Jiella sp. LLJ827 TaxID=2917712 RepID=UPI00210084CB|nr:DUF1254 domain-containing protein [Jiella sp. LLJ827]MCQ0989619.1 DUF1254 domain-containing protein [Jiella sp. LLJ827]